MHRLNAAARTLMIAALALGTCAVRGQVFFSEIMYHPVEEAVFNADGTPVLDLSEDVHEFIELHNPGASPISIAGWSLSGGIRFTFPTGSLIQPGQYLVVAKNPQRLAQVGAYALNLTSLYGPFDGQLSNEGETLRMRNAADQLVDAVGYSSLFPWAIGADALGADEEWTGLRNLDYQYRGRSLERVSFSHPSNDPANWVASPIPGNPSPGRPNALQRSVPLPVVIQFSVSQSADRQRLIRNNQPVRVDATFSEVRELGPVEVEYFTDDINVTGEPTTRVAMSSAGSAQFTATIPGMPDRSVVRYRIVATRAGQKGVVSPRPDDPFQWHAYFVTPARTSSKPIYDCFISSASLSRLGANIAGSPRRITAPDPPGNPRASWNATEPAIFVHDGVVRDIRMRHHGSRYNRSPGRNSFKWSFPRYNEFQGTDSIFETDKGNDFVVGHGLFINAGLPVSSVRYVDLYLNSNGVMQRLEQGEFNGDMLDAYHKAQQASNPGSALEASGEIFKSVGTIDLNGEGPYGRGDGRKLVKLPSWPDWKMYEWTYSLQNHGWRGHTDFKKMIDAMWAARGDTPGNPRPNVAAVREFVTAYFDIDAILTYLAVENWACPWDDTTQNHFMWRRSNGKWGMLPWDCDAWFGRGDNTPATSSIYIGEVGDPNNNFRGPNFIKDSVIKAYRQEYKERLYLLNNTFLHPENISAMGFGSIRSFANARFASVNQQCGLGVFQRPNKPANLVPASNASVVPGASFQATAYGHSATPVSSHARTLWEIRSAGGSFLAPVFKLTTSSNLTSLPIPFKELDFGVTYAWRCTYIDAQGHPSVASDESSFTFGGASTGGQTNVVKLVSIDAASIWKYNQSGADLGTAWKEPSFNDSAWPSGPALLALESAALPEPIRTPLTLGPTTFYFRRSFNYSGPSSTVLQLQTVIDDSVILYLNGKELWRTRVSGNPPLYSTFADSNVGDAVYEGPFDIEVHNLLQGSNVLAAEVHQSAAASSDVVFGISLDRKEVTTVSGGLVLNEILADNRASVANAGAFPDYVELFNASDRAISLEGFALSDDVLDPGRFRFPPGTTLAARGFLRVWCDTAVGAPGLHTGFALNAAGQTLLLLAPSATGFSVLDSVSFGPQIPDASIGRVPDGAGSWQLNRPTPNASNLPQPTAAIDQVVINEWLASPVSGDDGFELFNPHSLPVALGGHYLTSDLADPAQSPIAPLSYIAGNGFLAFIADGKPNAGPDHANFKLSAGGDTIALVSSNRAVLQSVKFGPQQAGVSQGRLPDGAATLAMFPDAGSLGENNGLPIPGVFINEVLSHSDPPAEDAIELFNGSGAAVDLSGWFLSDDKRFPKKYRFPAGTSLPAGGYRVVHEFQFNADTNAPTSFALSSAHGDEVVLSAVDASGQLTGYRATASFGAAQSGVSFGRYRTSVGADFTAMSATTFGAEPFDSLAQFRTATGKANAYPKISPVVISEIMYHPPDRVSGTNLVDNIDEEFIELRNASKTAVRLFDSMHPTNTWRVRGGISFDFSEGLILSPGAQLLLVSFDPATNTAALGLFRSRYNVQPTARILGPYQGKLANGSDRIDLLQPDVPQTTGPEAGFVPYVLVDRVRYADAHPWPSEPDGKGSSLHRVSDTLYGNDPVNWRAGPPSPGQADSSPLADSDGDGLPDSWEDANGLDRLNPADAALDTDKDGFTNAQEYAAGTDPRNPASRLKFELPKISGAAIQLEFSAVKGKIYQIEYRDSLNEGEWRNLGDFILSNLDSNVLTLDRPPAGLQRRFYRLRVF